LLTGAVAVQMLPQLPPHSVDWALAAFALSLLPWSRLRWCGFLLLAAAWTMLRAELALSDRLPAVLEGQDTTVVGTVHDLPHTQDDGTHFEFDVEGAIHAGSSVALQGRLRLNWYDSAPAIAPCARWQLHVRLRRPRGTVNPGGFDFERYALEQDIVAIGYVREDADNREVGRAASCIDVLRQRIVDSISTTLGDTPSAHLLRALAFGDQHAMDEHEWAVARATGIPHLIAISGLHIALFASFGVMLVRLLWKLAPAVTLRCPAPLIEAVASLLFAVSYALIAGFGLPTRRALVMIAALLVANLARRSRAPEQGLALAAVAMLAWNPLCVLSAGFWLSFVGVAWLMFCLEGPRGHGWRELVAAQGVASLGLLPLGIWFFGQSSLIGPIANLFAVPVICLLILPLTVSGALLALWAPVIGAPLLKLAGLAMASLWWGLEKIAAWPWALWYFPEASAWALLLAMLGAFWILLPRGLPARALGVALLLPLLWPARVPLADGEFDAYMLDVGQGLAMVVRTREHTLVYDAGARLPSGFDLGESTVVPALHALGIADVDRLIVSHGDNDHAGGAAAVVAAFPRAGVESGEPERLSVASRQCLAGETWLWNGVAFRVVNPTQPIPNKPNDRCCVIEVSAAGSALLLTGDITSAVEEQVAAAMPGIAHIVLQVPHHGSKTSSSTEFLSLLQPALALISAGYHNRFHHPDATVLARYALRDVPTAVTAQTGFVHVHFAAGAAPRIVELGRRDRHPYWRE
jgi:competence protein ComEC